MITLIDYKRITQLLLHKALVGQVEALEQKLYLFSIIDSKEVPVDLVTMNTEILVYDVADDRSFVTKLTYNLEDRESTKSISVFSALGAALLGMRAGEVKAYKDVSGKYREIQVKSILFQPEASGHFEL